MKRASVLFLFILLAACATPAPQVTVISEMTVTLTPTATVTAAPTLTLTPAVPAEHQEVYKYLDPSFVLETGAANADGVREIMTTNQLGEKVTVATVDASGVVEIGDILKYKLTMDVKDESCQIPLEVLKDGRGVVGQAASLTAPLSDRKMTSGKLEKVGNWFNGWSPESEQYYSEHPEEVPYELVGMCYALGPSDRVYPVRVYRWWDGVKYIDLTYVYRHTDKQEELPDDAWEPGDRYRGSELEGDGTINQIVILLKDAKMNEGMELWRKTGIIPDWLDKSLLVGTTHNK